MEKPENSGETPLYGWIQAACCLVAAGLGIASYSPDFGLLALTTRSAAIQARFEVRLVDDANDLFATTPTDLPAGIAILSESTGRPSEPHINHYARLVLQNGESFAGGIGRLEPWLTTLDVPRGERLVWQHNNDFRSYLVHDEPILTAQDVQSVEITTSSDQVASTLLRLQTAAAERFQRVTSEHVHERLAIVVNDMVVSAPVVQQAISGGFVQISLGGFDPEETRKEAEALKTQLEAPAAN